MQQLLNNISQCTLCKDVLPHEPRPVLQANEKSKIVIIGQAPGSKVQLSGVPWQDQSGNTLRAWLGIDTNVFYNAEIFALLPMGFCYPGKGKSGDLPPRPECAPLWHQQVWEKMQAVELTILIGQYAQDYYLKSSKKMNLTERVKNYELYLQDGFLPLPHPSPRNRFWLKKNLWFEQELLPVLKFRVNELC